MAVTRQEALEEIEYIKGGHDAEFLADIANPGSTPEERAKHESAQKRLKFLQDTAYGRMEDEPDYKEYVSAGWR